jgi:hypothetical protein
MFMMNTLTRKEENWKKKDMMIIGIGFTQVDQGPVPENIILEM